APGRNRFVCKSGGRALFSALIGWHPTFPAVSQTWDPSALVFSSRAQRESAPKLRAPGNEVNSVNVRLPDRAARRSTQCAGSSRESRASRSAWERRQGNCWLRRQNSSIRPVSKLFAGVLIREVKWLIGFFR